MFNGERYLQVSGTAMDINIAPSYANIFMGRLAGSNKTSQLVAIY